LPIPSALRVGRTDDGYRIRVAGQGTSRLCPALLSLLVVEVLDHIPGQVVVDLTACEFLDARFRNCLIDLHRHFGTGQGDPPRFAIAANFETAAHLRLPLDLDSSSEGRRPEILGDEVDLLPMEPGTGDLDLHLMEWFERLASLDGPHRAVFERLSERLADRVVCL
jgi:hypothetical protein